MENKVDLSDLVIIPRREYDRIIKCKNDYYFENIELKANMKVYEDYFYNRLFEQDSYEIDKLEDFCLDDYYVRKVITDIFEYGNIDIHYIIKKIKEYKLQKKGESNEEN